MHRTEVTCRVTATFACAFRSSIAAVALLTAASAAAFDFEDVARRASALSTQSYKAPTRTLSRSLRDLTYDQYRDKQFIRLNWLRYMLDFGQLDQSLRWQHKGTQNDHEGVADD